jgi:hypothetical protein
MMSAPYGARVVKSLSDKRGFGQQNMIRGSQLLTMALGTRFPDSIPMVFVAAYPKSGNTWTGQLIADYLELPIPQSPLLPVGFPAVVLTHYRVWKGFRRGVYLVRDGRDILTSLFAYSRGWCERPILTSLGKRARDENDIAAFVEWQLTAKKPSSTWVTWPVHVRSYFETNNPNIRLTRYEDMQADGETTLAKIVSGLTGEEADRAKVRAALKKYSFRSQTGRAPGEEASPGTWARKGQAGDWVNHFTPGAAEAFDHYAGDILIELGYEKDHSWVNAFRESLRGDAVSGLPRT